MGNCAFGLEDVTARKAGYNFGYIVFYVIKHSVARHDALCCKSKHSDGRQNASSFRASIVTADRIPEATRWNTPTADIVRDAARWSTPTADIVRDATGWSTPTADRVPSTCAEILWQPTEYFRNLRKYRDGRQSMRCHGMEYSHGRQSSRCYKMEYSDGRQSMRHNCENTLTADRVFNAILRLLFGCVPE